MSEALYDGLKIDPCKVIIGLWGIGNIIKIHLPTFQNNIMNQSI